MTTLNRDALETGIDENLNTVPAEDGTTWVEIASTGTDDEGEAAGYPSKVHSRFQ